MQNIKIECLESGTYVVRADTERFGPQEIMFESYSRDECTKYILRVAAFLFRITGDTKYIATLLNWMGVERTEKFRTACERNEYLTSTYGLEHIDAYESESGGVYLKMTGTRTSFSLFVDGDGTVKRSPSIKSMKYRGYYKGPNSAGGVANWRCPATGT